MTAIHSLSIILEKDKLPAVTNSRQYESTINYSIPFRDFSLIFFPYI